jgi:hypothetical protein
VLQVFQSSSPGENAVITFDINAMGGESFCGSLHATGDLTLIDTVVDFDSHFYDFLAQPADMFIEVEEQDDSGSALQCFVYGGYDYNADGCGKTGKWPDNWHTTSDGTYSAVANVTRAHFSGDVWKVCIGNGWTG